MSWFEFPLNALKTALKVETQVPVPVSDNGGSLTVDGSVAVNNLPAIQPVSDNGGSLTVDGSVAVNNLPAIQPVSDNGGSLTVDGEVLSKAFLLEVVKGNVPGHSVVNKFGRNPDIDSVFEAIWNGGGDYTGFDAAAAEVVEVFSDNAADAAAGTGARTVGIYGLDVNFDPQEEVVSTNGLTPVDTVGLYIRAPRLKVLTAGAGKENAGTIVARQKTTPLNIFAAIPPGYNQTMIAAYTIPNGMTGYMFDWSSGLSGKVNANCNARISARPLGEVFQVKEEIAIMGAGTSYNRRVFFAPKGPYAAKTDIKVMADTDTANTGVAAGFGLLLVEDGY